MQAVLISIQPKWCELIASGKKTIEVRNTLPKIDVPFKVYIYEKKARFVKSIKGAHTKYGYGRGKVIGEFVCDDIIVDERGESADVFYKYALLSLDEQKKYGRNKPLYGWHISDLKIYEKPKNIKEFLKPCPYGELPCSNCPSCERDENDNLIQCFNTVSRPPQSWCYVEERK